MHKLVPGRECGACTLCCIIPGIDKPELQKLPKAVCRYLDQGCTIYETRPDVCRKYYCGWRKLDMVPQDWRPDLSGVFVELDYEVPPQFAKNFGINLILVANPLRTLREQRFLDFVARCVNGNIAVFLGLPGSKGQQCARLPLNTRDMAEGIRKSRSETRLALERVLKRLQAHDYIPQILEFSGNDVGT